MHKTCENEELTNPIYSNMIDKISTTIPKDVPTIEVIKSVYMLHERVAIIR
jgi:hypothetical protein